MAHHIAELIQNAEEAARGKDRLAGEAQAADAIIKLWKHRSSFENRINPLADLKPIIDVMRTLDPNNNVWVGYLPKAPGDSARRVYDGFRRLMICLLIGRIMPVDDASKGVKRAKKSTRFQGARERELVKGFETWMGEFLKDTKPRRNTKAGGQPARQSAKDEKKRLKMLIVNARKALDGLEAEAGLTEVAVDEEEDPLIARVIRFTKTEESL